MNFLSDQICRTNLSHHVFNLMKTKSTINLYIICSSDMLKVMNYAQLKSFAARETIITDISQ